MADDRKHAGQPGRNRPRRRVVSVRTVRRVVQVLSLGLFLYLFAVTVGVVDPYSGKARLVSPAPVDLYLRADPLIGAAAMVSAREWIPVLAWYGIPVVALTILLGRVFCGWLCPLGVTLDAADATVFRRRRSKSRTLDARLKYYILAGAAATAILSAQIVYFLDPIAILTRSLTLAVLAPLQMIVRAVSPEIGSGGLFHESQAYYRADVAAFVIFAVIIGLNSLARRFWCRSLCPLGAMLGLLSRLSLLRRICGDGCTDCGACVRDCKTGAIHENPRDYSVAECIYCYNCTQVCPEHVISIPVLGERSGARRELSLSRRRLLHGLGAGAAWALLARTNASTKVARDAQVKLSSAQLIRPPGAMPEQKFLAKCIRCGECMKVCPTNGLQPAIAEAGLEGFWTPVLVPKVGECTQKCNLCQQVCPTGAIQPFSIEEKDALYLGTAVIDRSQCVVWNASRKCLVCDEVCSYDAIYTKSVNGIRSPFVDNSKCVGCGICENNCPIHPVSAIRVFSFGDKRHMSREEQRQWQEAHQTPD